MHGVVYKLSNGQQNYIGSTTNITKRLNSHSSASNVCSSILLYLTGNPVTCIILEHVAFTNREDLRVREQYWLNQTENCVNAYKAHTTPEQVRIKANTQYRENPQPHRIKSRIRYQNDPAVRERQCAQQRLKYHADKRKLERIREKLERMPSFV